MDNAGWAVVGGLIFLAAWASLVLLPLQSKGNPPKPPKDPPKP